ncbi:MAG: hypothetical protein OHK0021_00300 [Bryobacter sp.]
MGIVDAHTQGILTAATLMAHGAAFAHAVELAQEHTTLDIGVHLQIVQGPFPPTIPHLLAKLALGRLNVRDEFRRQTERILAAGIVPSHLDTHKHTHLLPVVLEAVLEVSREYAIPWIRRPFDLPFTGRPVPAKAKLAVGLMRLAREQFQAKVTHATDHFAGFVLTGDYTAEDLVHLIENLPAGSTEFMCHPGHFTGELAAAQTRLKESRARELVALTDARVKEALVRAGVRLTNFRQLPLVR